MPRAVAAAPEHSQEDTGPTMTLQHARTPRLYQQHHAAHATDHSAPRRRWHLAATPSDSGTEADDERSSSFLPTLPAPPTRHGRKGFSLSSPSSPLLPPTTYPDPERYRPPVAAEERTRRRRRGHDDSSSNNNNNNNNNHQDVARARARHARRERAEFVRRILEALSLGLVTGLCFWDARAELRRGAFLHVCLVLSVYCVYVLRLLLRNGRAGTPNGGYAFRVYFPAAADPAPLLYPVLLPTAIVAVLAPGVPTLMASNLVLSLCTIPLRAIPFCDPSVHWLLTIIPLIANRHHLRRDLNENADTTSEVLVLFLPLHRALVACIEFLSTTSLLAAETQLLSVGLINLLLFAVSPQTTILKALLWVGGLALFVSCRYVLRWSVVLARIPSWRFRRPRRPKGKGSAILQAFYRSVGGWLNTRASRGLPSGDSEGDIKAKGKAQYPSSGREPQPLRGHGEVRDTRPIRRRNTIPDVGGLSDVRRSLIDTGQRPRSLKPRTFLWLTKAQAMALKWSFALYVYAVVLATVAFPIRLYVQQRALYGNEPVGWGLGYLLGDMPRFRLEAVMWNMEHWICLPQRSMPVPELGPAERVRQAVLGAANTRLLICAYWVANIAIGLAIVFRLSAVAEVDTRRKVFHGMMVTMFLPTIFVDPTFVALALMLVLAVFLLLDLFRASQLPPISRALTHFLAPYVDGRDHRGPIVISPIFLLIGCAIPLWLSLGAMERSGGHPFAGWEAEGRDLGMIAGVVCVGMGDAAASLVGRRYGRRRWMWSGGKSLEGSAAFAATVVLGLMLGRAWLLFGGWMGDTGDRLAESLGKSVMAASGASFTEAVLTGGNDNVIVPVVLWLLVRGLKI